MHAKTFSVVRIALEESLNKASYRFDNASRTDGDSLVLQRTLSGQGFIEDETGRHLVPPGFAMLFAHGEKSVYGYPPELSEPYVQQFITFSPAPLAKEIFSRLRQEFGTVVRMPEDSDAAAKFSEILLRFRDNSFLDRYHETELLVSLLINLYREQVKRTRSTDPIEFGYHYLHNYYRQTINLKQVAAKAGISREHLVREFTKRYKISPGSMLRNIRMEHAIGMLKSSSLPIEDVAVASGFVSSDTFSRAFRRAHGCSPSQFRDKDK